MGFWVTETFQANATAPSSLSKYPMSTHRVPATVTGVEHIPVDKAETVLALGELTLKVGTTDRKQPSAAGMPSQHSHKCCEGKDSEI